MAKVSPYRPRQVQLFHIRGHRVSTKHPHAFFASFRVFRGPQIKGGQNARAPRELLLRFDLHHIHLDELTVK
ncbi:MAG: hypothetical protein ACI9TH_002240, partial [Kiritimatiellia bacterium]